MKAPDAITKLKLDKSSSSLIINAPKEYLDTLEGLSYDTKPDSSKEGNYDFVQIFATSQSELEDLVKQYGKTGKYDCLFWACYPKGTGSIKSDIKRDTVWIAFELIGLRPVSQIAIDETWSALRARPSEKVGK